ncbi:uncharacterized protein LOC116306437 [Actinia tenebrosa]|uniref:Uncharacterized protein LOC116306437 n=1 Tax=Actinia tenebrosa TaxID=6105 RepID=A0A6P8IYW6_ACTTE|nr:uncharacterized protein LOC116306437 [Actinia tenebrosa]
MKFDCDTMFPVFKAVSTISVGLFAGGGIYINIVEHNARMALDTKSCHAQWKASFDRAKIHQRRLALITAISGAGAFYCKPSEGMTFLIGGCSMLLIFPYTLFILKPASIDPIYDDYDKIVDRESEEFVRDTIVKWNNYHSVRSVLSLGVLVGFVSQILHETPFF